MLSSRKINDYSGYHNPSSKAFSFLYSFTRLLQKMKYERKLTRYWKDVFWLAPTTISVFHFPTRMPQGLKPEDGRFVSSLLRFVPSKWMVAYAFKSLDGQEAYLP